MGPDKQKWSRAYRRSIVKRALEIEHSTRKRQYSLMRMIMQLYGRAEPMRGKNREKVFCGTVTYGEPGTCVRRTRD